MKSITTKLSAAMIVCMIVAVSLVSVIHMNKAMEINKENSRQIMKLMCNDNARALDAQLVAIERSVDMLSQQSSFFLYDEGQSLEERMTHLENISLRTAIYTDEAYSVYFHFNPEKYSSKLDFFYTRDADTGVFEKKPVDNPYTYRKKTGNTADWYFASAESGNPCWLDPYIFVSTVNGEEVVVASYTVPMFDTSGELFGVLGMDYTLDALAGEVADISLYNSGYAFLAGKDGTVISHPEISFGTNMCEVQKSLAVVKELMQKGEAPDELFSFQFHGVEKQLTYSILHNGLYLVVTAPTKEINASVRKMVAESQILFAVVMISSVMIVYCIVYKFIHPLQLLSYASQQIMKGNMEVELPYHAPDEIGVLTDNFREMSLFLQEHISKINTMAYTDGMTGLKNKASYQAAISLLQERINQGFYDFAVVVFDLNNLKCINDTLGHEAGDRLIKNAAKIISSAFSHSPVFRIGGDEFVALLENDDFQNYKGCLEKLEQINSELNRHLSEQEQISLAHGLALFESGQDKSFHDVFARADKEMYRHKQAIKNRNS